MLPWNPPVSLSSPMEHHPQQNYQLNRNNQNYQNPPQQNQQQNNNNDQNQNDPNNNNNPPSYQPINLSSCLHFLQTEHRRYAKDRNEWEIERAEMRARIALLEGEKRGNEGALKDWSRRCRMLENALRGER